MNKRWIDRLVGAAVMYLVSGLIVTASLMIHTQGDCPWWLPPFWTMTWLYQVVATMVGWPIW